MGQQGRLGIARQANLTRRIIERQLAEIEAKHLVGAIVNLPGCGKLLVQVTPHAPVLGTLPGKDKHYALIGHGLFLLDGGRGYG
jgi:hypothetical protein